MDGQLRILLQATPLKIKQQLAPALCALAEAVGHGQQFLAAIFVRAHNHQNTLFFLSHSRLEVDPICPDVEKPPRAKIAFLPSLVVLPPIGFQARDGLGGETLGIRAQQRFKRLGEIARRHALEVKPPQQVFDRFRFAQIPRQDAGHEGDLVVASTPIPHARHLHGHRTNAGHDLALRQVTMTDQACPPILKPFSGKRGHQRGRLGVDRLFD